MGNFKSSSEYHFQTLRVNVDVLKIIQLGVTFSDENGTLAEPCSTWQFNFKFNLRYVTHLIVSTDMYAQDSIELLTRSGISFKKFSDMGIEAERFGEIFTTSGVVFSENVKWISFHSGYDFGYLLAVLTGMQIPAEEHEFFELLNICFPRLYDIKHLMKGCKDLKGGLSDVADALGVKRIGPQHQAGSDSLLTSMTFFKLRQVYFDNVVDDDKYMNIIYGLSSSRTFTPHVNGAGIDVSGDNMFITPYNSS